jgi:tetratricopeptide (TPR) repeat protein
MRRLAVVLLLALGAPALAETTGETTSDWAKWIREHAERLERDSLVDDATEEWIALASLVPDDPMPLARVAVLQVDAPVRIGQALEPQTERFKVAARACGDAVDHRWGQGDPALAYAIGRLRYAEGEWDASFKLLKQAKEWGFDPVRSRFWYYRAAVNRAAGLTEIGEADKAVNELSALLKEQPGHPDERSLLVNLASAHRLNQEPAPAIAILEKEIKANPGDAEAHYVYALILIDQGRLAEAENRLRETLLRAQQSSPKTYRDALLRLCEVEISRNRLPEAEQAAQQYLELAKDDAYGLYAMGRVRQAKGELESALKLYRRAASRLPKALDLLSNLKQVLFQLGESAEADAIGKRIREIQESRQHETSGDFSSPGMMGGPKKR